MVPCLLVTKSSPPSGGGLRKCLEHTEILSIRAVTGMGTLRALHSFQENYYQNALKSDTAVATQRAVGWAHAELIKSNQIKGPCCCCCCRKWLKNTTKDFTGSALNSH